MPRKRHRITLPWLHVDRNLPVPAEHQLTAALREGLCEGRLHPGFRLPSARQLADDLHVSRRVVANAYARLAIEGYVATKPGGATQVKARSSGPRLTKAPIASSLRAQHSPAFERRGEAPPLDAWVRAAKRAGHARRNLRETIASVSCPARGIVAAPEEIVVTTSFDEALSCAARLLADPGELVLVGHERARASYEDHGLRGLAVRHATDRPAVVHVHRPMDSGAQGLLLQWARSLGTAIVEEEHDGPTLRSLVHDGRIVYIGTCPGAAFLVMSPDLAAIAARLCSPPAAPLQSIIAELIMINASAAPSHERFHATDCDARDSEHSGPREVHCGSSQPTVDLLG